MVVFFSPKGGVGTTTLAVNTAVLLAGGGAPPPGVSASTNGVLPASRVLLIDLDLQFGQVATHLNLTPRYDVAGLASDDQALADPDLARTYLTEHSSGLVVLAAPVRPEADFRVNLEHLQRVIELMRPSFDHILVDLGSRLDPRSLWLLEQADAHVFVLFPEIAALRAMSLLMAFLAETTPLRARAHLVVNHIFPKELLKTRDVENLLRTKPAAEIPYTEVDMIRSVNEGVPLVISRPAAPAAAALRRVAQAVIGIEPPQPAASGKDRRRLFGRR
jgi:pilus assembly protein CpaE